MIALTHISTATENPLEQILEPMRGFDIAQSYTEHSHFIDFVIYLFVFIAVSKLTIGKRFEGRQGNMLAGTIGVALAISLAVTEYKMGFSIKTLGPIAGFILILLLGFVLFKVILCISDGKQGSSAIAFVVVYILLKATNPVLFSWLANKAPFINSILGIIFIVTAIYSLGYVFSLFTHDSDTSFKNKTRGFTKRVKKASHGVKEFTSEGKIIKTGLERITKKQKKQSKEITGDIKNMIDAINEHGNTTHGRKLIIKKIHDIIPKEHDLVNKLKYLKKLDARLKEFDLSKFKELKKRYDKASKKGKECIKKEILEQRKKINIEQKIEEIESGIKKYQENINYYLKLSLNYLHAGKRDNAKWSLNKAVACEKKTYEFLKKMQILEEIILKLTKTEIKQEKRAS